MGSTGRRPLRAGALTSWAVAGAFCAALVASCSYPDFEFVPSATAGAGATGGGGASGGALVAGNGAGGTAPIGGDTGLPAGAGGADGSGGEPMALCGLRPEPAPDPCFNDMLDGSETDIDCGGAECQPCFSGLCSADSDCLAGACETTCPTPFRMEYLCGDPNRTTSSPRFQVKLWNDAGGETPLSDFVLRYYLRRNAVAEPIHIRSGQALLFEGVVPVAVTADTTWKLVRLNADADDDFDAFIEITFSGGNVLQTGDRLELYQELFGGNNTDTFDQSTHYSFDDAANTFVSHGRVIALRNGELVWGYEPRRGGAESCFVRGINLNGDALALGGDAWESSATALVVAEGSGFSEAPAAVTPPAQGALAELLSSGYLLGADESLSVPVENGDYLVYVYVVSQSGSEAGSLSLEGSAELDEFQAQVVESAPIWAKLGPYPVDVEDASLEISTWSGALRIAGIELRTPSSASF
jgi:hypothetical protein